MEINLEILILVFSTLSIILGGFVVLYRKLSELQVDTAKLRVYVENAFEKIDDIEKDHEKLQEKHETIVKRLTAIELEHYNFMAKHDTSTTHD